MAAQAASLARPCRRQALVSGDIEALKASVAAPVLDGRVGMVEIYSIRNPATALPRTSRPSSRCSHRALPPGHLRASSDRLAAMIASGSTDTTAHEPLERGGELVRAGVLVRDPAAKPIGVVIASDYLSGDSRGRANESPRRTRITAS